MVFISFSIAVVANACRLAVVSGMHMMHYFYSFASAILFIRSQQSMLESQRSAEHMQSFFKGLFGANWNISDALMKTVSSVSDQTHPC